MIFPRVLPFFCMFLFSLFSCSSSTNEFISAEELHSQITNNDVPVILDVRTQKEFDKGHIKSAIHIPIKQLSKQLSQLANNKNDLIVVYCHGGPRARKAIKLLKQAGFENPIELKGHYKSWKKAGLPVFKE